MVLLFFRVLNKPRITDIPHEKLPEKNFDPKFLVDGPIVTSSPPVGFTTLKLGKV